MLYIGTSIGEKMPRTLLGRNSQQHCWGGMATMGAALGMSVWQPWGRKGALGSMFKILNCSWHKQLWLLRSNYWGIFWRVFVKVSKARFGLMNQKNWWGWWIWHVILKKQRRKVSDIRIREIGTWVSGFNLQVATFCGNVSTCRWRRRNRGDLDSLSMVGLVLMFSRRAHPASNHEIGSLSLWTKSVGVDR